MTTVALVANTLHYPRGGGHRWVYLNWALGFRSIGCEVRWVEWPDTRSQGHLDGNLSALLSDLRPHGLAGQVTLADGDAGHARDAVLPLDRVADEADLLVNFTYALPAPIVRRFRRSALVDIDPGLLQT
jgi:hypothetical protein